MRSEYEAAEMFGNIVGGEISSSWILLNTFRGTGNRKVTVTRKCGDKEPEYLATSR